MEVAIAREREALAETRAEVRTQKNTMEERVKATEQEARRRALDDFMQDFRVEERHYFRENKSLPPARNQWFSRNGCISATSRSPIGWSTK